MGLYRWLLRGKIIFRKCVSTMVTTRSFSQNSAVAKGLCMFSRRRLPMQASFLRLQPFIKASALGYCTSPVEYDSKQPFRDRKKIKSILQNINSFTFAEWKQLTEKLIHSDGGINIRNCDYMILESCFTSGKNALGKSYMKYLASQGKELNLACLGLYLEFCGSIVRECGEEKVLQVYQQLLQRTKVIDANLSVNIIKALTKTQEWRQSFKYISILRKQNCCVTGDIYSAIAAAAFRNGDYDVGWQIMDVMHKEEQTPTMEVFRAWLTQCEEANTTERKREMIDTLFQKVGSYKFFPEEGFIHEISAFCKKSFGWSHTYVKMASSGICSACDHQLRRLKVDEKRFKELQDEFVPRVLEGSDIYRKTTPEEWARFRLFLLAHVPFSAVVDGLNVCFIGESRTQGMKLVLEAVRKLHLMGYGRKILIIGRTYMPSWYPRLFSEIKKFALVYPLENTIDDDGFFIHAAFQSGLGTPVVTSDLLRNHVRKLEEKSLMNTFRVWQQSHQIFPLHSPTGLQFLPPLTYTVSAQKNGRDGWHVPYDDGTCDHSLELPNTWLCLRSEREELENEGRISAKRKRKKFRRKTP